MTDLKRIKAMFDRAGIEYTEEVGCQHFKDPRTSKQRSIDEAHCLTVERGYSGFATSFVFDRQETLMDVGAYE